METLKRPDQLWEPDPRNLAFAVIDGTHPDGARPLTLDDEYAEMAALELPPGIPEPVCSAFAVVRNLWLYAWFHWPLYVVAGSHACRCIEGALRLRYRREHPGEVHRSGHHLNLGNLLEYAVRHQWISGSGFEHFRRMQEWADQFEGALREPEDTPSSDSPAPSDQYVQRVAKTIPRLRNWLAHGDAPGALLPSGMYLVLQQARDIISQVLAHHDEQAA